jgi:hypothetical protein
MRILVLIVTLVSSLTDRRSSNSNRVVRTRVHPRDHSCVDLGTGSKNRWVTSLRNCAVQCLVCTKAGYRLKRQSDEKLVYFFLACYLLSHSTLQDRLQQQNVDEFLVRLSLQPTSVKALSGVVA